MTTSRFAADPDVRVEQLEGKAHELVRSIRQCRDDGVGPETASMNLEEASRILEALAHELHCHILDGHHGATDPI